MSALQAYASLAEDCRGAYCLLPVLHQTVQYEGMKEKKDGIAKLLRMEAGDPVFLEKTKNKKKMKKGG